MQLVILELSNVVIEMLKIEIIFLASLRAKNDFKIQYFMLTTFQSRQKFSEH